MTRETPTMRSSGSWRWTASFWSCSRTCTPTSTVPRSCVACVKQRASSASRGLPSCCVARRYCFRRSSLTTRPSSRWHCRARPSLENLIRNTSRELEVRGRAEIDLSQEEYAHFARALQGLHVQEAKRMLYQAALRDRRLDAEDLPELLEAKKRRVGQTGLIEWIEPLDGMAEIGGLPNLREWVARRGGAFSEEAQRFGLDPPKGVLMVGVPGTGKSLACRALAGEWGLPLLRLDSGRLYDKYIGETEANLRRVLALCEAMAPAVLWIDEIEKALAAGAGRGDDGLSQRMLATILTWMQERPAPVFLVATSNDITKVPVEILRRGRFDEIFFVDLPNLEERKTIFSIHFRARGRDPEDFDVDSLAEVTEGYSGAEIEGAVVAALYHAFSERTELTTEIVLSEVQATRTLSQLRPRDIDALRSWGSQHARLA